MLEILSSIGDFFVTLFDFVIGFFEDIAYVVSLLTSFLAKIPDLFGFLPVEFVSIILVIIGVVVVYKILGREG